eukprot:gnl/TRDRNA2_/TRDRNA2_84271_c0_seq1.p1 gnl/TRDRNA2_/TRDRNA2_84271_c0~~gnl/TRDRNA2_/TRDRNA2_84271_c0_seq1.p1  ORF type:complete len:863 (+),score=177.80 gnl/TRDRNA2_/TRDRNA2_84271_c0_seq1:187-2775(+)
MEQAEEDWGEPRFSKATLQKAANLPIVARLNSGDFDSSTLLEFRELFQCLDMDGEGGTLAFEEIKLFMVEVLDPPAPDVVIEAFFNMAAEETDGVITPEYFLEATTVGPLRRLLKDMQKTAALKKQYEEGQAVTVSRDFMIERLDWRTARDDAFRTLPFSLVYLMVFIGLVITHLRIWERQQLERAMEDHIAGWGFDYPGPYLKEHIPNVDNMYIWLETSGMQACFNYCSRSIDKSVEPHFCELAPRSALLGDVMIKQTRRDGSEKSQWLLHSPIAQAYLEENPMDTAPPGTNPMHVAALEQVKHLRAEGWADTETYSFQLIFTTYSSWKKLFALTEVTVIFDGYGYVVPMTFTWSVVADPYPMKWVFGFDFMFLILIIVPLKGEVMEICAAVKSNGCAGFKDYWGFWNFVDWFAIINGMLIIAIWVLTCMAIGAPSLVSLLEPGELSLLRIATTLDEAQLNKLRDDLAMVIFLFRMLHISMGLNTVAILSKFFKAFQSNVRLQVVTDTLAAAAPDIFHFMVVFLAIFIGYAVIGHIMFGGDMIPFNSFGASFNTVFLCLMGDFGWYSDVTETQEGLASGMPYTILSIYFWSLMILVLLILLNMLLAIIMENYSAVVGQMQALVDKPTLWIQSQRYYKRMKATKGFIPLDQLLMTLQDPDPITHPEPEVTNESLLAAFPNMKPEQATFLTKWLTKDAKDRMSEEQEDEAMKILKETMQFLGQLHEGLNVVQMGVHSCMDRIAKLEEQAKNAPANPGDPTPAPKRISKMNVNTWQNWAEQNALDTAIANDVVSQLEQQRQVTQELSEQLARQQRSSHEMAKAVTDLTTSMSQRFSSQNKSLSMEAAPAPAGRDVPACCVIQAN